MASAKSKGLLKSDDINVIRELKRRECLASETPEKSWLDSDNVLCSTWYSIFPEIRISGHSDIEKPVLEDESFGGKTAVTIEIPEPEESQDEPVEESMGSNVVDNSEVVMQLMAASITRQDRLIERIDTLIDITSDLREVVESKNNVDFPVEESKESTVLSSALEQCLKMMDGPIGRNT